MDVKNLATLEPQADDLPAEEPAAGELTYVVQRRDLEVDGPMVWIDVATVAVPPRTKRRTIVQRALDEAPNHKPPESLKVDVPFRVLDADSAAEIPVGWDVPPAPAPELRIGWGMGAAQEIEMFTAAAAAAVVVVRNERFAVWVCLSSDGHLIVNEVLRDDGRRRLLTTDLPR